ncbi:HGR031Wp [Eremothecium sinecaudum]|uniref:Pre-mRNA-splicing factor SLT11 n=1 Tax=Eremothecium sinecaudum TaxID=45286 RepID=A0A0X8HVW5_9SACH|nr:HGR031Wp [Eremothecium sinecaudum]AMD22370.1 HGR031Wp [Eremothecium sinecaudum]
MESQTSPTICDQCFSPDGNGSKVRMTRVPQGAACKLCSLPFTLYHFKIGSNSRPTKALICSKCATERNICQCCMLDLSWKLPINLRDQILSILQGTDETTSTEVSHKLASRFLALNTGIDEVVLTGDEVRLKALMVKVRDALNSDASKALPGGSEEDKAAQSVQKNMVVSSLFLTTGLEGDNTRSFFLYGIEPNLPEWEIVDVISKLVRTKEWQDRSTVAVVVRHEARCAGIRFKSEELAKLFVLNIDKIYVQLVDTGKPLRKGVLHIRNFNIHVVDWPSFNVAVLGSQRKQWLEISELAKSAIRADVEASCSKTHKATSGKVAKQMKKRNNSTYKKGKLKKRASSLEL